MSYDDWKATDSTDDVSCGCSCEDEHDCCAVCRSEAHEFAADCADLVDEDVDICF